MANHVCSLAISRVLDVCCSDYIFANVCGKLLGYSLATGSLLLAGRLEPLFVRGCELTGKVGMVSKQLFVKISHQPACMLLVGTMKGSSSLHLFQLHDTNSEQSRRYVWEASQQGNLPAARRFLHPFQARSNHWTTDGSCFMSPIDFAHRLLDELVALAVKYGSSTAVEMDSDMPPVGTGQQTAVDERNISRQTNRDNETEQANEATADTDDALQDDAQHVDVDPSSNRSSRSRTQSNN